MELPYWTIRKSQGKERRLGVLFFSLIVYPFNYFNGASNDTSYKDEEKKRLSAALWWSDQRRRTAEVAIGRIYEIEVSAVFVVAARPGTKWGWSFLVLLAKAEIKLFFPPAVPRSLPPRARARAPTGSPCGPTNESSSGADNLMKAGNWKNPRRSN